MTNIPAGRFQEIVFSKEGKLALGRDRQTGGHYLSIPVVNRLADYDEYYAITEAQMALFRGEIEQALVFAEASRRRENDHLLIVPAGTDRGVPM